MIERNESANDSKGVDADPKFRAGVPMENPGHVMNLGDDSPVGANTLPWKGLSGVIRKAAYATPPHKARHWMMLLFADRVDVVEGLLADVAKFPRRGKGTVVALASAAAGAVLLLRRRRLRA